MKQNTVAVTDAGPLISLAIIGELDILEEIFERVYIPYAVAEELQDLSADTPDIAQLRKFITGKIRKISIRNFLFPFVDYGESEAILLCKEINADYLIIDDKKAREIAEELGIICIGTLGILYRAKDRKLIAELRSLFIKLIKNKRYYSTNILNDILDKAKEELI